MSNPRQYFKQKKIQHTLCLKLHAGPKNEYFIRRQAYRKPTHGVVAKARNTKKLFDRKPTGLFNFQHAQDKEIRTESCNEGYEERLQENINRLKTPPLAKVTRQQHNIHHKYFDELMEKLETLNVPTVEMALQLVADMHMQEYSARYIGCAVSALKSHPQIQMNLDDLTFHPDIKAALSNIRKERPIKEDTRIPITPDLIREFSSIADHDFSPIMAITMKAVLWLGLTCMLRQGEICNNMREDSNTLLSNMSCSKTGICITFHGWKLKSHRRTLKFPYLKGTEDEAFQAIKKYKKVREAREVDDPVLFVDNKGKPFNRYNFSPFLYHLIDHSTYQGLNITCHSLRIGGATARHSEGMEIKEIMCLGR